MAVQPLSDRGDVAANLVQLDDPQPLFGAVIFEQRLEALSRGQILERQRPLTAVLAPQHALGLPRAVLLGVNACHTHNCYVGRYVKMCIF